MTKNKKAVVIIVCSLAILIGLGVTYILNSTQILRAVGLSKPAPVFVFNESKAPGWWAAENYNSRDSTKPDKYEGSEPIEKLPVASMNVFKGEKGQYKTACFILSSYYDYKTDTAQLSKNKEDEVRASTSMRKIGDSNVSINMFGEPKSFTMKNYELVGPDAENAMKGMSYGWIEAGDGYVGVNSVCPTASELDETSAVIGALSLVKQ